MNLSLRFGDGVEGYFLWFAHAQRTEASVSVSGSIPSSDHFLNTKWSTVGRIPSLSVLALHVEVGLPGEEAEHLVNELRYAGTPGQRS